VAVVAFMVGDEVSVDDAVSSTARIRSSLHLRKYGVREERLREFGVIAAKAMVPLVSAS
jgi:hypothetical protein